MYFVAYPDHPQLFDLESDPEELHDLGRDPGHVKIVQACHAKLTALLDPEEVDRRAKRRQAELIERNGGWDAIQKKGGFGYSPPPGFKPDFT
jgi:choline-sulfatase